MSLPILRDPYAIGAFALNAVVFLGIAVAETMPRHTVAAPAAGTSPSRIFTNFSLGVTNALVTLLLPLSTVTAAELARQNRWGLLNHVSMAWLAALLVLVALRSLAAYAYHRASHVVPLLWRVHRVHHTDRAFDLSTAFRSHPIEVLLIAPVAIGIGLASGDLSVYPIFLEVVHDQLN